MNEVRLIRLTPAVVADVADAAAFERNHGARSGEYAERIREAVAQSEAHRARTGAPRDWGGYLVADPGLRVIVGVCGFVGAPSETGEVEIAYGTWPSFERRGYASAMAAALVAVARDSGAVRTVIAHTLPERNASARLLERAGFVRDGTAEDPDEGTVWRWILPLPDGGAPTR